jgi:hypothetical protein
VPSHNTLLNSTTFLCVGRKKDAKRGGKRETVIVH